jgi:hypothetical protein
MQKVLALGLVLMFSAVANADIVTYCDEITFTSDLEDPGTISLPTFDTTGGDFLTSVTVDVSFWGSAEPKADNDDEFQGTTVRARVIRNFSANGPGVASFGANTVNSPFIDLAADDGDGDVFDATPPDGHDFGVLGFNELLAGSYSPAVGPYETAGPGDVDFTVSPALMVNDLQFDPVAPDAWQLEVQDPTMTVKICVTYDYVPEPAGLSLLSLGALALLRKRR